MTSRHRSRALGVAITAALALFSLRLCLHEVGMPSSFHSFRPRLSSRSRPLSNHRTSPPVLLSGESPDLVRQAFAAMPRINEADAVIAKAEEHFEAGKRFYMQGDAAAARREFDAAMDVLLSAPENTARSRRAWRRRTGSAWPTPSTITIWRAWVPGRQINSEVVYDKSPLDRTFWIMTFPTDPNLRPKVKEEIEATVSQLPLAGERRGAELHPLLLNRSRPQGAGRRPAPVRPLPAH